LWSGGFLHKFYVLARQVFFMSMFGNRSLPFGFVVFSTLLLAVGCDSSTRNPGVAVYPTKVTVTYKGAPVEGALVAFSSAEGQRSAVGKTNAQGVAQLTTFDAADGAVPGEHRVMITKDEVEVLKEADPNDPTSQAVTKVNHLLPQRYGNPRTSGLTATVAEGDNSFTFELTD
jgi:hypothetical protein